MNKKVIIFGTRPEFIKLIPVMSEIGKRKLKENYITIFTGQHEELIRELFISFDYNPDITISFVECNNSLSHSFSSIIYKIQDAIKLILKSFPIDYILGLGDTTSCACAAMMAFLNGIPFAHIEAGLRTNNLGSPFPEEYFRRIISLSSTIHFAPTKKAVENLLIEGICQKKIILSGNTIVDAIGIINKKISDECLTKTYEEEKEYSGNIIITCHRRENQNEKFSAIVETINILAKENPMYLFLWVGHQSPFVISKLTDPSISMIPNLKIIHPVSVMELYSLYARSKLIITDSGGIQEEAPSFNIPVIVIRDFTERNESVEHGYSILAGNCKEKILNSFNQLINRPVKKMKNPYGDGKAAQKIVEFLQNGN